MNGYTFWVVLIILILIFYLWVYILQVAWNNFMPSVFGYKEITLTESFALLIGVSVLFSTTCIHSIIIPSSKLN